MHNDRGPSPFLAPIPGMGHAASRGLTPARVFSLAVLCVQAFVTLSAPRAGEGVTIDHEVLDAVHGGSARVLVEVRLPEGVKPEGELTAAAQVAQRRAIAAAQDSVLAGLASSHFSLVRRYETVPLLLLEVQDDAVTALDRMASIVARVRLDIPNAPAAPSAAR